MEEERLRTEITVKRLVRPSREEVRKSQVQQGTSFLSEPLLTSQPQPLPSTAGLPLTGVQVVPCTDAPGKEGMEGRTCSPSSGYHL